MTPRSNRSPAHRTAYSAGGVIFRVVEQQVEVALIATDRGGRWGLPKGHVNRGETAEAAALREVAEETGLEGAIVRHLATIEYWFRAGPSRVHKYVDLFLMRYERGDVRRDFGCKLLGNKTGGGIRLAQLRDVIHALAERQVARPGQIERQGVTNLAIAERFGCQARIAQRSDVAHQMPALRAEEHRLRHANAGSSCCRVSRKPDD